MGGLLATVFNGAKALLFGVKGTDVLKIAETLSELYFRRRNTKEESEKDLIDADIEMLKLQLQASVGQDQHLATAWIRPSFAAVTLFYYAKVMIWDASLHLGTTDQVSETMVWAFTGVIGFYFVMRVPEKLFTTWLSRKR